MNTQKKPATGCNRKAGNGESIKRCQSIRYRASMAIWRMAYTLEEARQECGTAGQLWKQAGCCIALAIFRLAGGRI